MINPVRKLMNFLSEYLPEPKKYWDTYYDYGFEAAQEMSWDQLQRYGAFVQGVGHGLKMRGIVDLDDNLAVHNQEQMNALENENV